jgi:ammonium transporter, Amt family
MIAYLGYSIVLSGWVYPIIVHAIWSSRGFLSATAVDPLWGVGMVDFAGSGVVHLTGGTTALFAAMILGPRRGRFHDESGRRLEVPREFPGSSFSLQVCRFLNNCEVQSSCTVNILRNSPYPDFCCWTLKISNC